MIQKAKEVKSNTVEFSKKLAGMIVAVSLLALGAYAVYLGHFKTHEAVYTIALLFAGAINMLVGLCALYKALMHN